MFYVYVLTMNIGQLYIGSTGNLRKRIEQHKSGEVSTTKKYLPVKLIYYECYLSEKDARHRESMLKKYGSTWSHLKHRIKDSIKESQRRG